MKSLLVFGSGDFGFDSGAVRLLGFLTKHLPGWDVRKLDRPEQLMQFIGSEFVILDVAEGIGKPMLIADLGSISYAPKTTAHDVDLAAFLRILKEVGHLGRVSIVAIPNNKNPNKFKDEVVRLITECAWPCLEKS